MTTARPDGDEPGARCPECGTLLEFDEVDIGVGTMRGSAGCPECYWTPPLSDVRTRRRPRWDAPVNSPSPWLFLFLVVAIIAVVLGALELAEWIGGRWGG